MLFFEKSWELSKYEKKFSFYIKILFNTINKIERDEKKNRGEVERDEKKEGDFLISSNGV